MTLGGRAIRFGWLLAVAWLFALLPVGAARAGGGPENLFLVVNSASWASQSVANHFVELRRLPPSNVFYLDWTGGFETIDSQTFAVKIISPVLDVIEKRGLADQIDYVIYSSDFPYAVDLSKQFSNVKFGDANHPTASLTSATYYWNLVLGGSPLLMDIHSNFYLAPVGPQGVYTRGFRSWYGWGVGGQQFEAGGQPYMLSTMLAFTSGRGTSVDQAIHYLKRSAGADGTRPKGTIYFANGNDKRSSPRSGQFAAAVAELKQLGVHAVIINAALPTNHRDVAGAMIGVATFDWRKTHCTILPGAICESLTSYAGVMSESGGQTPLTEFLRYGAAGSGGTVVEPYNPPEKFPTPQIHVHYARGCTLAEAYYQSIAGPAQMLVVGDPLCRPWARIPTVRTGGLQDGAKLSGAVTIEPTATFPDQSHAHHFELFVDGRRAATALAGEKLAWDSRGEGDGYHEMSVVGVTDSSIETQGRTIVPVTIENAGRTVELTSASKIAQWGQPLAVHVRSAGASQIFLVHNNRVLGRANGAEGEIKFNPQLLGLGPVRLQAVAAPSAPPRSYAFSPPLVVEIEAGSPLPPMTGVPQRLKAGLAVKLPSGKLETVTETRDPKWLAVAGVGRKEAYVVQGYFDVKTTEVYQFQLWHEGDLQVAVDNSKLFSGRQGDYAIERFVSVPLAAGKHRLTLSGTTAGESRLRVLFGGTGTYSISGETFRHPAQ